MSFRIGRIHFLKTVLDKTVDGCNIPFHLGESERRPQRFYINALTFSVGMLE